MLDLQHLPGNLNNQRQQVFVGSSATSGGQWQTWVKPKGVNWVHIFLVGKGGNGGNGAIGANSTAAGGGGGGSGGQTSVLVPAWCLPDTLFMSLAGISSTTALGSVVSVYPSTTANYVVAVVGGGGNGGNAAGATAGAAGAAGSGAALTSMAFTAAVGVYVAQSGQAGIIGGVAVSGAALTVPTTGLKVTGGTGGGGLPAAAATGTTGGGITGAGPFPAIAAATGQATATSPPNTPDNGYIFQATNPSVLGYINYGGLGSGSTHGTATGGGLVQVRGGDGAPGCGGGGSGGALTGSTAATGGNGGPSFCVISCW